MRGRGAGRRRAGSGAGAPAARPSSPRARSSRPRQRARQPLAEIVEPLALRREQRLARAAAAQPAPASRSRAALGGAPRAALGAARRARDQRRELGAHRHRHLGRRGRRRRAHGRRRSRHSVVSVSCPTAEIDRDRRAGDRADHDLLVERPQILDRAAAARDDQQVGPRHRPVRAERVEAAHRRRDLLGRALALHQHRPDQHMASGSGPRAGGGCRGSPRRSAR